MPLHLSESVEVNAYRTTPAGGDPKYLLPTVCYENIYWWGEYQGDLPWRALRFSWWNLNLVVVLKGEAR